MAKPKDSTQYLIVTLPWIIIIGGVVGNAFGVIILLRKRFRKGTFGLYLLAIAFLDTIFLLSNTLFAAGILILSGTDIQALSPFGCKLVKYVIVASRAMSAWILVVLSVERALTLAMPHKSSIINTRKRAMVGTIAVVVIQGLIYVYNFTSYTISEFGQCDVTYHIFVNKYDIVLNIFDFLNYAVIPSVIMAICNAVLIYFLRRSQDIRRHYVRDNKGTIIIIILMSIAFIVLTTPMTIFQILYESGVPTGPDYVYVILYSLDLLNHAINFILYCLSGSVFRHEIKVLFHPICKHLCFKIRPAKGTDMTSMELSSPSKESQSEPGGERRTESEPESEPKDQERSEPVDITNAQSKIHADSTRPQGEGQERVNVTPSLATGAWSGVQRDEHVYCESDKRQSAC